MRLLTWQRDCVAFLKPNDFRWEYTRFGLYEMVKSVLYSNSNYHWSSLATEYENAIMYVRVA